MRMSDECPSGCDSHVWDQLVTGQHSTGENVSIDGLTMPHKTHYESGDLLCELCHDWGVIYGDLRFGRMDRTHTVYPKKAKHIMVLSIGSRKFPHLACDACNDAGLGAIALRWGLDGSVSLDRYRMMRGWNRVYTCAFSEC